MSMHTPGPWAAPDWTDSDGRCVVMMSAGGSHSRIAATSIDRPAAETKANARLIAAAPDLLAACEALLNLHPISNYPSRDVEMREARRAAESAIAKAHGRP